MGCEASKEENHDIVSIETDEQFRLSYRELVTQDRGHIFQLYHFSTILNRSNYSIVRRVTSRASQQSRICKIVPLLDKKYFTVVAQVEFMKKLDHPNITQIIEYFLEPSFLYIVQEFVPGERILRQLNKCEDGILFDVVVEIMKQLLRAVDFCHRKYIAHRTITTQNILLFFTQPENQPCLKLIDFSQACTIGSTNLTSIPAQKRNIILSEDEASQTDKIDIYDCAIVFYALLLGKRVKENCVEVDYKAMVDRVRVAVKGVGLGRKVEGELMNLLESMLAENPKARPSAAECLNHHFFSNFGKKICSKKALQNMMRFQSDGNLRYLLSMYASINMTSAIEKAQHLSQFYNLDTNKDGQIQLEQLSLGIQNTFNMQPQAAEAYAEQIFGQLDKNKNGSINFSQYITGTIQLSKLVSNSFLDRMFKELDTNRDGYISEDEINQLLGGIERYNVLGGEAGSKGVDFGGFRKIMGELIQREGKPK